MSLHRALATRRRKMIAGGLAAGLVLSMGGAAWAAWTLEAQGSTTSTETTGTAGTAPITVGAGSMTDALVAGGPAGAIPIDITNSNTFPLRVSGVVVAVTGTSAGAACPPSNFTVTQGSWALVPSTPEALPYTIPAGQVISDRSNFNGVPATVAVNAGAPDACQGVTISLSETVS